MFCSSAAHGCDLRAALISSNCKLHMRFKGEPRAWNLQSINTCTCSTLISLLWIRMKISHKYVGKYLLLLKFREVGPWTNAFLLRAWVFYCLGWPYSIAIFVSCTQVYAIVEVSSSIIENWSSKLHSHNIAPASSQHLSLFYCRNQFSMNKFCWQLPTPDKRLRFIHNHLATITVTWKWLIRGN